MGLPKRRPFFFAHSRQIQNAAAGNQRYFKLVIEIMRSLWPPPLEVPPEPMSPPEQPPPLGPRPPAQSGGANQMRTASFTAENG